MGAIVLEQMAEDIITPDFFRIAPRIAVDPLEHELTQSVHRSLDDRGHGQMRLPGADADDVGNHGIDPLAMGLPQYLERRRIYFNAYL